MKKHLYFFVSILVFFAACTNGGDDRKPRERKAGVYGTTSPSQLYFKNMRSSYYYREPSPQKNTDIYRLRKFAQTSKRAIVYPVIVNNWIEDEAYLFLRKNDYPGLKEPLRFTCQSDSSSTQFKLAVPNKKEQYDIAEQLYECIAEGSKLYVHLAEGDSTLLYDDVRDRNNFIRVMKDYYRLIEQR